MNVINQIIIVFFVLGVCTGNSEDWLQLRLADLDRAKSLRNEERFEVLGVAAATAYPATGEHPNQDQRMLSREAVDQLLEIPGHAEYFGKKIKDSYSFVKNSYKEGKSGSDVGWTDYLKTSIPAFKTLAMLPSPETVNVLGEMLDDDWKWPDYDTPLMRGWVQDPLDICALSALSKLPIASPPSKPRNNTSSLRGNLDAWKLWYLQIKEGRRTFRFVGDPVDYDLRGPSKRGVLEPLEPRNLKRPGGGDGEASQGKAKEKESGTAVLPYAVATILVLAGLYFAFRNKKIHG